MNQLKKVVQKECSVAARDFEQSSVDAFAGSVLRHLRRAEGLTVEAVSLRTGIAAAYIIAIENGEKSLDMDGLYEIAECLSFDPHGFIAAIGEFILAGRQA